MKNENNSFFPKGWNKISDPESKEIIADLNHGIAAPIKLAAVAQSKSKETLAQHRAKNAGLTDSFARIKQAMTFSGPQVSNIKAHSTQLDRFRNANNMAHKTCNTEKLHADSGASGLQYAATELKPGVEVFQVCTDGLDPLKDGTYLTEKYQVFSVKAGKVEAEIKAGAPAAGALKAARIEADKMRAANDPGLDARRATERHNAFMHKMKS